MNIGFIGAGNMSTAIIRGILTQGLTSPDSIYITASTPERSQQQAAALGVQWAPTNQALVESVELVILGVKPQIMPAILAELAETLTEKTLPLVSIAAGLTLANLADTLPNLSQPKLIRVMPNMNVSVGQGVSAITANDYVIGDELAAAEAIFQAVGSTYRLAEKDFQNFTSLAGCSPAYTALYIDALSQAGVKNGLPKDLATQIATEAVLGTATLLKETSADTPRDLIDKVCSPAGTTVAGLVSLEQDAFTGTVIRALDATIARDQELSQ